MFLDYEKIGLFKKLTSKEESKNALLEYLENDFGVTAPKNYSFDRMVREAEKRIMEKKEEEYAMDKLREEAEKFQRTNVTPHDILKGDKSVIDYTPPLNIPVPDEFGQFTAEQLLPPAPVVTAKILAASIADKPAQEIRVDMKSAECDIILHDGFKPTFQLTMRTSDGRECTTIGYWVIDEIIKLGSMWKLGAPSSRYANELMSLIYYIQRNGEVIVRESRNSTYVILK